MKVIIKEKPVDYSPDFPEGWQKKGRDPFKFPVILNNTACFIKRFEKGDTTYVTGWDLLSKLKGKNSSNLQRIFDIRENNENGKPVYYIFYEFQEGRTLDSVYSMRHIQDIIRLKTDLFSALKSLKELGFWFPDFTEKNMLWDRDGKILLLDLDSTHSVTTKPSNRMEGSKDYWIAVNDFYKDILKKDVSPSEINGSIFNWLQTVFLVLHLKIRLENKDKTETERRKEFFDSLPACLANTAPSSKEIFIECAADNAELTTELDKKIQTLCDQLINAKINYQQKENKEGNEKKTDQPRANEKKPGQPAVNEKITPVLTDDFKKEMSILATRTKIHANMGLVFLGIVIIGAFILISRNPEKFYGVALLYILFAMIVVFPVRYLSRFSNSIKQFIKYNDPEQWNNSFSNMKTYFKFMMIYRIILVLAAFIYLAFIIGNNGR